MRAAATGTLLLILLAGPVAAEDLPWDEAGDEVMTVGATTPMTPVVDLEIVSADGGECDAPTADIRRTRAALADGELRVLIDVRDIDARPVCAYPLGAMARRIDVRMSYVEESGRTLWIDVAQTDEETCVTVTRSPPPTFSARRFCDGMPPARTSTGYALALPETFGVPFSDGDHVVDLRGREIAILSRTDTLVEGPTGGGRGGIIATWWNDEHAGAFHT